MKTNLLLLLILCPCASSSFAQSATVPATVPEVNNYRTWGPVTKKPFEVTYKLWDLCRPPTPKETRMRHAPSESGGFGQVYVNEIAKEIFKASAQPVFPVGTVVVKEKVLHPNDTKADSLGIMIKQKDGWEFAFIDSDGSVTRDKKLLTECYTCHQGLKDTDQVSRAYLNLESKSRLITAGH